MEMPKMPQIVQTGLPSQVDDPAVLQFVMQAVANAQLVRLRKLEESKAGTGVLPMTVALTDITTEVEIKPPWISLSGINDGPGAIQWSVNDPTRVEPGTLGTPINPTEQFNVNMLYPVITRLFFRAAPGATASVRVFGKQGKPADAVRVA